MSDGGTEPEGFADLIDLTRIPDIYADGIAHVEPLAGNNFRVTYYRLESIPGTTIFTRVVCARIVRPRDSLVDGRIRTMLDAWPRPPEHFTK